MRVHLTRVAVPQAKGVLISAQHGPCDTRPHRLPPLTTKIVTNLCLCSRAARVSFVISSIHSSVE